MISRYLTLAIAALLVTGCVTMEEKRAMEEKQAKAAQDAIYEQERAARRRAEKEAAEAERDRMRKEMQVQYDALETRINEKITCSNPVVYGFISGIGESWESGDPATYAQNVKYDPMSCAFNGACNGWSFVSERPARIQVMTPDYMVFVAVRLQMSNGLIVDAGVKTDLSMLHCPTHGAIPRTGKAILRY